MAAAAAVPGPVDVSAEAGLPRGGLTDTSTRRDGERPAVGVAEQFAFDVDRPAERVDPSTGLPSTARTGKPFRSIRGRPVGCGHEPVV